MKKILFLSPLIITLLSILYILKFEDMNNEGVIVGFFLVVLIAIIEILAHGLALLVIGFNNFSKL